MEEEDEYDEDWADNEDVGNFTVPQGSEVLPAPEDVNNKSMKGQFIFSKFGRSVGGWLRGTVWGLESRGREKGKY
jgi:hypothetical protein